MNPANVVRLSTIDAAQAGRRMGVNAALAGADVQDAIDVICGRLFWRVQHEHVRRTFAFAFCVAFEETERRSG